MLEVKVDSDVQTTEEKQNAYAEQLSHIAEQMAIRNRQRKRIWKTIGIAFAVIIVSKDEYTILKKESLLFDYEFLKVLTDEYHSMKKKNMVVAIPCTVLFIIGLLTLAITVRGIIPWTHYHSLVFLGLSVGLFGFVYSAGTMETYEVLVHNEKYSNSFWFKVKRKAKLKIDKW